MANHAQRKAHNTVKRISGILKKAKKHHRQAQNSVKAVKKAHVKLRSIWHLRKGSTKV